MLTNAAIKANEIMSPDDEMFAPDDEMFIRVLL